MFYIELKAFDAVARGGGFQRGADLLGRSQPTVTAQVRALEERYRVELFFRTRGQLARLTPAGQKLFETTRTLFGLEQDAEQILKAVHDRLDGVLRLGVIAPRSSMPLVSAFATANPHIGIDLKIMNSASIQSALRSFEIDVGILGAHDRQPALYMRRAFRPEIVLLAKPGLVTSLNGRITRQEFARHTLLLREQGSETRALLDAAMRRHHYTPGRTFEISSREATYTAAEHGLGLAPISVVELDPSQRVEILRLADFEVWGEMYLACAASRRHTPLITAFLGVAEKLMMQNSP